MKKTQKNQMRQKSVAELSAEADQIRQTMLKSRLALRGEGKPITMKYRAERRQLARINTIITEKSSQGK